MRLRRYKGKLMKKKLILLLLLALAGLAAFRYFGGSLQKTEGVAARYREHEISWKQVSQARAVSRLLDGKGKYSDRELVDRMLKAYILWDEARALGLSASESELATALKNLPLPDGKSSIEEYLRTLSGSLEGNLDTLRVELQGMLSLDKLRETIARQSCAEQGVDFDLEHLPESVSRSVNEKLDALIESRMAEVEYFF